MRLIIPFPTRSAGITCPFCGKIIARGQIVMGVYQNGIDDFFEEPKTILASDQKATCCPQGAMLYIPYASDNHMEMFELSKSLSTQEIQGQIAEDRFMGFGKNPPDWVFEES